MQTAVPWRACFINTPYNVWKGFEQQIPFYFTHSSIWVRIGTTELHIMLLGIYKFRANRRGQGRSFLAGVNYITLRPYGCREGLRNFESNECLGKTCVRSHGEHHLQTCFAPHNSIFWTELRLVQKLRLSWQDNATSHVFQRICYRVLKYSLDEISHHHRTYPLIKII
jgi:hypothetical protein